MVFNIRSFSQEDGRPTQLPPEFVQLAGATGSEYDRPVQSPALGRSTGLEDVLGSYLRERQTREGIEFQREGISDQIESEASALTGTSRGVPISILRLGEAFEAGGIDSARAFAAGQRVRGERIEDLAAQDRELAQTLQALDTDGIDPVSDLLRFYRETPDFPAIGVNTLRNSTPEELLTLTGEAFTRRAEQDALELTNGGRIDSGFSGPIGTNIDGFRTLMGGDNLTVAPDGVLEVRLSQMNPAELTDYWALALRFAPPEDWEADGVRDAVLGAIGEQSPNLSQGQLATITDAVIDRASSELNYSSGAEALTEWLAIQSLFQGEPRVNPRRTAGGGRRPRNVGE